MRNPLLLATRGLLDTVIINSISIASEGATGIPTVIGIQTILEPNSIVSQEVFGSVVVENRKLIAPTSFNSGQVVGAPNILTGPIDLYPSSISSLEFVGLNTNVSKGPLFINPVGIRKLLQFGRPTIQDGVSLTIPQSSRATYQSMAVYLRSTGRFVSLSSNGLIMEWLTSEGIGEGQFNGMLFKYWESKGFEGSYNDKWLAWIRS